MGNFVIPTLEEIEDHEFLRNIKTHNQNNSTHLTEPDHLLLLSYLNGKIKTKPRAVSHRSSSVSGGSSKRNKSEAGLKRTDMVGTGGIDGAGRVDNVVASFEFLFSGGLIVKQLSLTNENHFHFSTSYKLISLKFGLFVLL